MSQACAVSSPFQGNFECYWGCFNSYAFVKFSRGKQKPRPAELRDYFAKGIQPTMARLTLARKIAAITNARSICALFNRLTMLFMALGVIRWPA